MRINIKLTPRQIRLMNEVTLEDMAKFLGITPMTVFRKEHNKSSWKLNEIEAISRKYNVPIENIKQ